VLAARVLVDVIDFETFRFDDLFGWDELDLLQKFPLVLLLSLYSASKDCSIDVFG
jgi:hypothetical protein